MQGLYSSIVLIMCWPKFISEPITVSGLQWFAIEGLRYYKEGTMAIVIIVAERDDHLEVNWVIVKKRSVSDSEGAVRKRDLPMQAMRMLYINGAVFEKFCPVSLV